MHCSRCATELADNATFCPRCGLNTTRSQSGSFSYLPAGTPPWPTSVPAQIPYVVDSKANTLSVAPSATPTKRSRSGTILTNIAVLVLVPLLAASATLGLFYINGQTGKAHTTSNVTPAVLKSTPGAQNNPTTLPDPGSFKETEDSVNTVLKASLKYPSDWQAGPLDTTAPGMATFPLISPQGEMQVYIQRIAQDSSLPDTPEKFNEYRLQLLAQKYSGVQPVEPQNAKPTIGGIEWAESDATFPNPQNQASKVHFSSLVVLREHFYYTIYTYIDDQIFQPAMTKYVQPIFDSFTFLP